MKHSRVFPGCLVLLSLVSLGSVRAQQRPSASSVDSSAISPARSESYELDRQNADHVSASPEQIREVLAKDPGLLVELKHWAAHEATSNGQLVDDSDLTDQAIFDRLGDDLVFRSAATRLLQRFGYLLPAINPDSPQGKQQELVLKERARRLVQIESQEDAAAAQPSRGKDSSQDVQRTNDCDPDRSADCPDQRTRRGRQQDVNTEDAPIDSRESETGPRREYPPNPSPLLRADLTTDRPGLSSLSSSASGGFLDSLRFAAMDPTRDLSTSRSSLPGLGALPESSRGDYSNSDLPLAKADAGSSSELEKNLPPLESTRGRRNSSSPEIEKDFLPGAVIHTSNPYSDIPSLYDMYVQVPALDRNPQRFGVDILRNGLRRGNAIPMDLPVGPDYVVGPGDGLSIDLWGGVSQRMSRVVDREGRVSLPEVGPVLVSGKTLGDVQMLVQQSLRNQFRDVSADISLSRLRTVRIYVVGEVVEPGAYDISSLSTPFNAIVAAQGITPRGSLRSLQHYRGKQLLEVVDAYDLLLRGVGTDQKRLENGDSLLVPPVGPQVTVEGMVRRPAIYELHGEKSLEAVLELAGGILPAAALQHVEVERLVAHQNRTMFSLDLSEKEKPADAAAQLTTFQVQDGDRIHIFPIAPYNEQTVYLQGHVLRPGRYSYKPGMNLHDLISSYSDLLPEPSGQYAEIIRLKAPDFHPTIESFDLAAALANPANAPQLQPLDTIRIFSRFDFQPAPAIWVGGEVRSPGKYRTSGQARLRDAIFLAGGLSEDASLAGAQLFRTEKDGSLKILSVNLDLALAGNPADNLVLQPRDRVLIQRNSAKVDPPTVYIKGEVTKPGRYPLTSDMRIEDLIRISGGLKRSADSQVAVLAHQAASPSPASASATMSVSLTDSSAANTGANSVLRNGDVLTIRQNPGWLDLGASVTLRGEVQHPGTYGILPGESLNSVLQKAGGFTDQAFPYATLLTRRDVRDLEMKTRLDLISRVKAEELQLKALPEADPDQKNAKLTAIAQTETTLTQLQTNLPVGRVVISTSPDPKSFDRAAANTSLRNGDVILVPKKANYVLVNGQVFNSTAVGFINGRSAKWYLGQAGGVTQLADKKAIFVIRANGSVLAARNNSGFWTGDPLQAVLLPGDSIVVPEKAPNVGTRNWSPLIQSAQVATSIALAVAYLKP